MQLDKTPHRKISMGSEIYYIARYPEGDAHIHCANPRDRNGYAGRTVRFLLEDGTVEAVKGPYCRDIMFDFGIRKRLSEHLADPTILPYANRLTVGRNLSFIWRNRAEEIIFEERGWALSSYTERLDPAWHRKQAVLHLRDGSRFIHSLDCSGYKHAWT